VRQTCANAVATAGPQVFLLVLTPLLVSRIGLAGFGVWTFCLALIGIASSLDGGAGITATRYFAVYRGRADTGSQARLATLAAAALLSVGVISILVLHVGAGPIAGRMHVSGALRADTEAAIRAAGYVVCLSLLGGLFAGYLRAAGAFSVVALGAAAGVLGFIFYAVTTTESASSVATYVHCAIVQSACASSVWLVGSLKKKIHFSVALPPSSMAREVLGFAWKTQIASASALLSLEADSLVIAAIAPVRTLGLYGVAATAATAFRNLPFYALSPIRIRVATIFGASELEGANRVFWEVERRWRPIIVGYSLIGAPLALATVYYWLTARAGMSVVLLSILLVAYATDLAGGVRVAYANAVGRPGLLARLGAAALVINVALTVPLAIAGGAYGVVGATAVGSIATTVYLFAVTPFDEPGRATSVDMGRLAVNG
jgi:O-antigen/teichoic acid export membrane protein